MATDHPLILLIEDEAPIADTVAYALGTEGFRTDWHQTGGAGLSAFRATAPALVILDIGLPDMNGFDVCRKIREQADTPVIFLTARSGEVDCVVGLEIGGDDYVVKPFSPRELAARVRARLRHRRPEAGPAPDDRFEIDDDGQCIRLGNQDLGLTRYEFRLLRQLLRHPQRVYSRDQLLELVWEEPDQSYDRTVDTHVKTLRRKIRSVSPGLDPIRTHRGLGYSYCP